MLDERYFFVYKDASDSPRENKLGEKIHEGWGVQTAKDAMVREGENGDIFFTKHVILEGDHYDIRQMKWTISDFRKAGKSKIARKFHGYSDQDQGILLERVRFERDEDHAKLLDQMVLLKAGR